MNKRAHELHPILENELRMESNKLNYKLLSMGKNVQVYDQFDANEQCKHQIQLNDELCFPLLVFFLLFSLEELVNRYLTFHVVRFLSNISFTAQVHILSSSYGSVTIFTHH